MNKKKEMTDFFEEHGPKRRDRDVEWLDKRITRLEWILTRAKWQRMPAGSHHMFMESGFCPYPLPDLKITGKSSKSKENQRLRILENFKKHDKKAKRLIRLAKLHNRYLSQYCDLRGLIINLHTTTKKPRCSQNAGIGNNACIDLIVLWDINRQPKRFMRLKV